jgi:hypothetical protein
MANLYNNSPFANIPALVSNQPGYAYGSFNDHIPNTGLGITSSAVASNVVTLGVHVNTGNIPAIGSLIWVVGTSAGSPPGDVNVSGVALTAVSIDAVTGIGTVSFADTNADYSTVPDQGSAIVRTPEIADALAVNKSQQFAVPPQTTNSINLGREITWAYICPSVPSTIAIQLEGAINDTDAEYAIIGSSQTTPAGFTVPVTVPNALRFLRLRVTATTGGTLPTIIGKILI